MRCATSYWLGLIAAGMAWPVFAQSPAAPPASHSGVTAPQLFAIADAARDRGDYRSAEIAYRALAGDPDPEYHAEARFRLAMMLADQEHRYRDAAVELRRILDEKPGATRVRLELARIDALMGDLLAARRELRAVQASNLPPAVEQLVRFYANALIAKKRFGGSLEAAVAPDSNVNRATRADTLGTVIGDFTLDQDARARSGIGLALRGQGYARFGLSEHAKMLLRVSGQGSLYREAEFDDIALAVQGGPELSVGADRFTLSLGPAWRWYGNKPYSLTYGASGDLLHPMGKRAQLRLTASASHVDNRRNDFQDGNAYALAAGVDRAFTQRFGGGVQVSVVRTTARDPGYADATAAAAAYLFHEFGRTTLVAGASYSHLEADARLFLYPERRRDDRLSGNISATFRSLTFHTFAPFARLVAERNRSTVGIYSFSRVAGEFGFTSAF